MSQMLGILGIYYVSVIDDDSIALDSKQKTKASVDGREHGSFSADRVG